MKVSELRVSFLNYFENLGHELVASSSLVPRNDKSLLFTNAGMVQFKNLFLGAEQSSYSKATSSQKCVRAGGKHNDLENVGYTARHHTFFEMLGNFSFGDYFKKEAISYSYNYLTKELKISPEKLWVTVYKDDDESYDIWVNDIGFPSERISKCGDRDNFWSMGDTGPCGPCTEIFYDHGEKVQGGPPGSVDEDGDRYIEIWNIVFMQSSRDEQGNLSPLPKPCVDTGMGLERMAAVLQNVHSNYDIDLFRTLIKSAAKILNVKELDNKSLRVIADHIRSCAFLIVDGVSPSNEGRGYVLRRIMRRALRHGNNLGCKGTFFYKLVQTLVDLMGDAYPSLKNNQKEIEKIILHEEEQFAKTLEQGLKILNKEFEISKNKTVSGDMAFKLYDTYGFPIDLTTDIAKERGYAVDKSGFDAAMLEQKNRARAADKFNVSYGANLDIKHVTKFVGYNDYGTVTRLLEIYNKNNEVTDTLNEGEEGLLVLNSTTFYAEGGGQVADTGNIKFDGGIFEVKEVQKIGTAFAHYGIVSRGSLKKGAQLSTSVNIQKRQLTACNHSATHLLHAALKKVLGNAVEQKGSLVDERGLRFDFSYPAALSVEQLKEISYLVNEQISRNSEVITEIMTRDDAVAKGAVALFGEKYDDKVRVLTMGDGFSVELCGGTHVKRTGDIGVFKIVEETSVASGVRRIEALTSKGALEYINKQDEIIKELMLTLNSGREKLLSKIHNLIDSSKEYEKQLKKLNSKLSGSMADDLIDAAENVNGVSILVKEISGVSSKDLLTMVDKLKAKLEQPIILLALANEAKVNLIAVVDKKLCKQISARDLVNHAAAQLGGKGGGRDDMAQAGAKNSGNLQEVLTNSIIWIKENI